jgi:hypothetical protein
MNKAKIIQDIIVNLNGITDSLEALIGVLEADRTEPEAKVEIKKDVVPEKAKKSKQSTLEEVREAMAEKSKAGHREEVKAVLLKYGAKKLTSLDEKHYADVLKEVGEIK